MSDVQNLKKMQEKLTHECEYCKKIFTIKGNLIAHQKSAKYCLTIQGKTCDNNYCCEDCKKVFTVKDNYLKHVENCLYDLNPIKIKEIIKEHEILKTKNSILTETVKKNNKKYKNKLKELETKYELHIKEVETRYEKRITELESHLADIALKASTKPTTLTTNNTKIKTLNQLQPINFEEIKEKSSELTIEHIKRGIEGYIDHITPQLEGKISCPDVSRKIIKYKNSDNQIITDLEGAVITKKICGAIKDTNNDLIKQYSNEMYEKMQTSDLEGKYDETAKLLNEGSKVLDAAIQVNTASKGEKTELGDNIVKQMCLLGSKII